MSNWITGFIFNVIVCQTWICLFQRIFLKENLLLMCLAKVWFCHFRQLKSDCWISRIFIFRKNILNYFVCLEVWKLVEKWNVYESHIFPRALLQTCRLETTSLCLNTRLIVKRNFKILNILIGIYITVWLLCAHPLMTSIILRPRRRNTQENFSYIMIFMF